MVTKPTGRPIGRPRKPRSPPPSREQKLAQKFLRDDDRYAVALLDAKLALEMESERACAVSVAVWQVGIEVDPARVSDDGRIVTNWRRERTQKGAQAATLEGRAVTLRAKQRRTRSAAECTWRTAMASAFMIVLGARCDSEAARSAIVAGAESVGEGEFARWFMLPMVAAKFSSNPSPEFPGKTVSTNEVA